MVIHLVGGVNSVEHQLYVRSVASTVLLARKTCNLTMHNPIRSLQNLRDGLGVLLLFPLATFLIVGRTLLFCSKLFTSKLMECKEKTTPVY